jgi:hypothetical protein
VDQWLEGAARDMAQGVTRRTVLRGMLVSAGGAVLGLSGVQAALAGPRPTCESMGGICTPRRKRGNCHVLKGTCKGHAQRSGDEGEHEGEHEGEDLVCCAKPAPPPPTCQSLGGTCVVGGSASTCTLLNGTCTGAGDPPGSACCAPALPTCQSIGGICTVGGAASGCTVIAGTCIGPGDPTGSDCCA